ncbi:helix-turn-helix transcriptional regulator [Parasphingopyxis algicola]|uniref:helix-turn-helix domain-containing protein n=1 Tax=Parasphingopyxis algicola TaxID=2026624 RepID=UPI0015A4346F|nr:AraC family transcriptional regulator [Parasphingopyxis algicola]QLC25743.1 helix-turn-helix transcriptional regulator [Parasphingopyxis algicola]
MPRRYQDIYPSDPLVRSEDVIRPRAADLLTLEFFEAPPARMPTEIFDQHHILINLKEEPHRVENWRNGEHRDFTYRRNEIVVTPAGIESGWRWHVRSRVIVITILPDELRRFAERELGMLLTDRQLNDQPQFEDADITAAAELLLDALQSRETGSEVMYESLARVFVVKLLQKYGEEQDADIAFSRAFTARHYKRVLDFIAAHYGRSIAIEDMAREAGLSESHFARLFKRTIGDTPYQFLMRYRVERAEEMVADRDRRLIDIALACGFSDQAHFSRLFKQFTGETPSQRRKRI